MVERRRYKTVAIGFFKAKVMLTLLLGLTQFALSAQTITTAAQHETAPLVSIPFNYASYVEQYFRDDEVSIQALSYYSKTDNANVLIKTNRLPAEPALLAAWFSLGKAELSGIKNKYHIGLDELSKIKDNNDPYIRVRKNCLRALIIISEESITQYQKSDFAPCLNAHTFSTNWENAYVQSIQNLINKYFDREYQLQTPISGIPWQSELRRIFSLTIHAVSYSLGDKVDTGVALLLSELKNTSAEIAPATYFLIVQNLFGLLYTDNQFEKAQSLISEALAKAKKMERQADVSNLYFSLAKYYAKTNQTSKAIEHFELCSYQSLRYDQTHFVFICAINSISAFHENNETAKIQILLDRVENFVRRKSFYELIEPHLPLFSQFKERLNELNIKHPVANIVPQDLLTEAERLKMLEQE